MIVNVIFEQAIYNAFRYINYNNDKLNPLNTLIEYNTYINYAKSLNLAINLYYKTYEPVMLTDYITVGCADINGLLKMLYYKLFINDQTNCSIKSNLLN